MVGTLVADTSSLVSLATVDLLDTLLREYDVHTTEVVVGELREPATYDERHGGAARAVLDSLGGLTVVAVVAEFTSSRVDAGEGSCVALTEESDARFLLTDDLRALPELQAVADAEVAISPIVLKALVERGVLEREDALEKLDALADRRDWLGAPIYRRAQNFFE